jgi:hypothetical protein
MPLVIVLFIGILAFGLFDLTLGRPLPVSAVSHSTPDALDNTPQSVDVPSIKTAASLQVAHCAPNDAACELLALYHFVVTTVIPEAKQKPWLHAPQHPVRTLFTKTGDGADMAMFLSSLLDQRHIRNYVIVLPKESYVLACGILPSALRHASGPRQPTTSAFDPSHVTVANDSTALHPTERIDAYAWNVSDAPCPCLLLDPTAPTTEQPGVSLSLPAAALRYALDLNGHRHELVYSGL